MDLRRIDDRAGCVSHNSIVQTHKGIFWAGVNGFYWSDGLKVEKISDKINKTYRNFVSNPTRGARIVGTYEPNNERVIWSVTDQDGGNNPDMCMVLDLRFNYMVNAQFTTLSGGDAFRPSAIVAHKETSSDNVRIYRADTRGFVFYHEENIFSDPKLDLARDPSDWITQAIIFDYKSCFLDFGSKFLRKFVPRILISAENTTNLSLAIRSSNDNNRIVGDLKPIRYRQNITWGDDFPLWGTPEPVWNLQGIIEEWRRFPARGLRCNYKQIQFTNAEAQIVTSDVLGQVMSNNILKTFTLSGTNRFPTDIEDFYMSVSVDNFTNRYLITSVSPDTVVVSDPQGTFPQDGTYSFIMTGIPKNEIFVLNGYVMHWSPLAKSHTPFISGSLGGTPS